MPRETAETLHHPPRKFRTISRRQQFMPRSLHHQQLRSSRNQFHRRLHLRFRPNPSRSPLTNNSVFEEKGSASCASAPAASANAADTKAAAGAPPAPAHPQPASMPACRHRSALPEKSCQPFRAHRRNRRAQTLLVPLRASSHRWPVRSRLPERQIASQHRDSCRTKCLSQRPQQRSLAVGSGAVCQHKASRINTSSTMQKPPHRRVPHRIVFKFFAFPHRQSLA